jgi:MYXO-CTERM domain-containing protein
MTNHPFHPQQNGTKGRRSLLVSAHTLGITAALLASLAGCSSDGAQRESVGSKAEALAGDGLVISQIYGGSGNSGGVLNQDFVELFNRSTTAVALDGLSIQYGSATGVFANPFDGGPGTGLTILPTGVSVAPGSYYLVAMGPTSAVTTTLPTPDFTGPTDLSGSNGKVALARVTASLGCGTATNRCTSATVVDMIGYGTAVDYEGTATAALSATKAALRKGAGCTDTDANSADFDIGAPAPRNSATAAIVCDTGDAAADAGTDAPIIIVIGDDGGDASVGVDAGGDDGGAAPDATLPDDAGAGPDATPPEDAGTGGDAVATDDGGSGDDGGASEDGGAESDASEPDASEPGDGGAEGGSTDASPPGDAGAEAYAGLVISQVFGGGGNSGATYNRDFVELFNRTTAPLSLQGLSLQYASKAGIFGSLPADGGPSSNIFALPNATVAPGAYFLVGLDSNSTTGASLPAVDGDGALKLSGTDGKVALAVDTASLGCGTTRCDSTRIIDMVGYGAATDFEGSGPVAVLSSTHAALRKGDGCVDTRDNTADFDVATPAPRNSATPAIRCTGTPDGGSGTPDAGGGSDASSPMDSSVPPTGGDDSGTPPVTGDDSGTTPPANGPDATAPTGGNDAGSPAPVSGDAGGDAGDTSGGSDDNGCSCRSAGSHGSSESGLALFAGLFGAVLVRRKRRASR